ncbi:MAG TPA: RNA-directed DNA polymerase [Spirochaetota bacterium]|nr:RNA-directed DNA polymerase [Spirochaetota bacterium]
MSKKKINKYNYERCLLTEISPFETPLIWSNWGSYNYYRNLLQLKKRPEFIDNIFKKSNFTIPYNYIYSKSFIKRRILSIIHPNNSNELIGIYKNYSLAIIRLCQKSSFSIRKPYTIAKYFNVEEVDANGKTKDVELLNESQAYASSFYVYGHYSHLHKFFESNMFTNMEKTFRNLTHIDIQKCFPSIYTHTINWAIRGKSESKDLAISNKKGKNDNLGDELDHFMQNINHKETNGILVGPEFSRIFAEIILQDIDKVIEVKLKKNNILLNVDYCCFRYIDDYFLFYNEDKVYQEIIENIVESLEKYKLYINSEKIETYSRPFISTISIKKINISKYINLLSKRIKDNEKITAEKEISEIRSLLKNNNEENYAITNYFISSLIKQGKYLSGENGRIISIMNIFIDIVFYLVRIDIRVSSIYKLSNFINNIKDLCKNIDVLYYHQLKDKIINELISLLDSATNSKLIIETMNILILLSYFKKEFLIPQNTIGNIIKMIKNNNEDEELNVKRLTYFEIISLLYYIQDDVEYNEVKKEIVDQVKFILEKFDPKTYSESIHLFLDIISCPYLDKTTRHEIIEKIFTDKSKIGFVYNFINKYSWYTNWNAKDDLNSLLLKKDYLVAYD